MSDTKKTKEEVKALYTVREAQAKKGSQKCPYCNSRDWWQTGSQGKQCDDCYRTFD